jgi:membrane-associated HD superfamily phosphohydrolase
MKSPASSPSKDGIKVRINNLDVFTAINLLLFIGMCFARYFDRFIHYRGRQYLPEFFVYAVVIITCIVVAWSVSRHLLVPYWLLLLLQTGILMHFFGGLVFLDGVRLYEHSFLGIRYDKYVHFMNAFSGICMLHQLQFPSNFQRTWLADGSRLLLILGAGAVIEIVEFLVVLTVAINGVGDYANNMQDLIANALGASTCIGLIHIIKWRRHD